MIEVLANYAIVIVIVDFGGYFYLLINDRKNKTLITNEKYDKLFTWEVTTSQAANFEIEGNELCKEDILPAELADQRPKHVYVGWMNRECGPRMLYIVYRLLAFVNNSMWYYFAPFVFKYFAYVYMLHKNREFAEEEFEKEQEGGEGGEGGEGLKEAGEAIAEGAAEGARLLFAVGKDLLM